MQRLEQKEKSQAAPSQRQQLAVSMHLPVLLHLRRLRSKAQGGFQRCHQLPLAHLRASRNVVLAARGGELVEGWVETWAPGSASMRRRGWAAGVYQVRRQERALGFVVRWWASGWGLQ